MSETTPIQQPVSADKYVEIAKTVQAERMRSPLSGSGPIDPNIPVKDLLARHQKALGADWHLHTCAEKDMKKKAYQGYEPVFEQDGSLARNDTDVVMKIPTFLFKQIVKANSQKDARVLSAVRKKVKTDSTKTVPGVSTEFSSGMATVGPGRGRSSEDE